MEMAVVEEVEDMIGVENMTGVVDMRNDVRKERRSSPQRWQQEVKLGRELASDRGERISGQTRLHSE